MTKYFRDLKLLSAPSKTRLLFSVFPIPSFHVLFFLSCETRLFKKKYIMKTNFTKFLSVLAMTITLHITTAQAQSVSDFENFTLPQTDTFWNGQAMPLGTTFTSAEATFPNNYDTSFGGYWAGGWAYSNMKDSTTGSSANLYGARTGVGYNSSANYAVGQQNSWINLSANAIGKVVDGFYVTNSTYAARVIENGNNFSRKFGDTTGTGHTGAQGSYPDYFLLTVYGWSQGAKITDSVNFYFADYRGADSLDYIVTDWQWVDLKILGNVDSLQFTMRSSDVGTFGINTPLFFCMDDFTTSNTALATSNVLSKNPITLYPNPVQNELRVSLKDIEASELNLNIFDMNGKVVVSKNIKNTQQEYFLDFANQTAGMYIIQLKSADAVWSTKITKQ